MSNDTVKYMTANEYLRSQKKPSSKYRNKKVYYDGHKFDSQKEFNRYLQLKLQLERGLISSLKLQPRYKIVVGVKGLFRSRFYIGDFEITYPDGRVEVEDVKSVITAKDKYYRLKKQLMYTVNNILIKEI